VTVVEEPTGSHPRVRPQAMHRPTGQVRVVSSEFRLGQRIADIWRFRELLVGMTRKQMKVQYKDSILGLLWSLLNPAATLIVYYVVFQIILKNGIPFFAIYLMSGVLVWNFFSVALPSACGSVVANASVVKKVAFPREIPALAAVGAALIHFGLQCIVMAAFLIGFHRGPALEYMPLLVPALLTLILLTGALGVLFAAVNVRNRDLEHLLQVALNIWFWATPIVYQFRLVRDKVIGVHSRFHLIYYLWRLNPITPIVLTFQRALYGVTSPNGACIARNTAGKCITHAVIHILPDHAGPWWYLWQVLVVLAFAIALFMVALKVFGHLEGNFAEEL
jgi:ABC-2 type transport system permease protein